VAGLTLDSGALIAFERADRRVMAYLKEALRRGVDMTIPAVVVAEVWRGGPRSARVATLLSACLVEPLDEPLARAAGEAMAAVKRSTVLDAIVVASAAVRGDLILTTDHDDLARLCTRFPAVRLASV
jgi:predicted nucleic acid-binding protein